MTRQVIVAIMVVVAALTPLVPASALTTDTMTVPNMYPVPGASGVGSSLNAGGGGSSSALPGSPAPAAGCTGSLQAAQGGALSAGLQNHMTISLSARKPPGKILTSCLTTLISLMKSLDIFSNAGPWSMQALVDAVVSYGEQMICDVIQTEFNNVMGQAFNSVAFLKDVVPCGVQINVPMMSGGGGGGFCQAIGGPLVNIGSNSGTLYQAGSSGTSQRSLQGAITGQGNGNALQLLTK